MKLLPVFTFLIGLITKLALSQNSTYFIGDTHSVTWDDKKIIGDKVNVVLKYNYNEIDRTYKSNWTLATVDNTGSATVGGNLGTNATQLTITSGSMGEFWIESTSTTNKTLANDGTVTINQSVIFAPGTAEGQALSVGSHLHKILIHVRQKVFVDMGGSNASWTVQFVTVDEDSMTWTQEGILPMIANNPTKAPTSVPTVKPTTKAPTASTGSNKATTFFSTTSPNKDSTNNNNNNNNENGNGRMRLAEALAAHKVSLGMDENYANFGISECKDDVTTGYCQVNISVSIPSDAKTGGPWDLVVGITDGSSTPLQYYGVNVDSDSLTNQFLTYDEEKVDIKLTLDPDYESTNDTIYKYESVEMKILFDDSNEDTTADVFVVISQQNDRVDTRYALECGDIHDSSFYTAFGWKTLDVSSRNGDDELETGTYDFELYWAVNSDTKTVVDNSNYQIKSNSFPMIQIGDTRNDTNFSLPAVTISGDDDNQKVQKYSRGNSHDIEFETSFNEGTNFTGYLEQCNYTCVDNITSYFYGGYFDACNSTCMEDPNSTFSFTTGKSKTSKVSIDVPDYFFYTDSSDKETATYIVVSTVLCNGEDEITTSILVDVVESKSSKNQVLSAGAIVGIVCAGVLVLGLAAWWLCMKKSGGDGYRELNE